MSKMDEEKWMMAQDAVDFGIADSVLEEEEFETHATSIKNYYMAYDGLTEHFGLPEIPSAEKTEPKQRRGFLERIRSAFNKAIDAVEVARASHPGVLMGGTKINLMLNNRDTNQDEIVLTRTLKED